jgi:LacI family transcriptional regulator
VISGGPQRSSPPNLAHVAERAGVSTATVSNVLNYPEKVAEPTRAKVLAAIDELGYTPNQNAQSLKVGASQTIGLVLFDLTNSLFVDIARGAQREARKHRFNLQLASSDNDNEQQDEHVAFFDRSRVSGIVLAPMFDSSDSISLARRHNRPVVVVNYQVPDATACTVLVDNELAGYMAMKHLIELGCTRVAFVGGRWNLQPVQFRLEGARRAVAESNGAVTLTVVETIDLDPPGGTLAGRQLAAMDPADRPDGVLGVTDLLAMSIIGELTGAGIRVPDDVRVMGCDYNAAAWGGTVPVSSVGLRGEELGEASVALLIEELANDPAHVHRTIVIEPSLVVRESTVGRQPA